MLIPCLTFTDTGEFSVLCPSSQPCACPTLNYVNVTTLSYNLLGCYDPIGATAYFCNTDSLQWLPTATSYGRNALILGSGVSNIGTCWNESKDHNINCLNAPCNIT